MTVPRHADRNRTADGHHDWPPMREATLATLPDSARPSRDLIPPRWPEMTATQRRRFIDALAVTIGRSAGLSWPELADLLEIPRSTCQAHAAWLRDLRRP